jgi:hypothetical protein
MLGPIILAALLASTSSRIEPNEVRVSFDAATAACAAGEPKACHRLAERVLSHEDLLERARYLSAFEAGCAKRIPDACAGLGMAEIGGAGVPRNSAKGEQHLAEAR